MSKITAATLRYHRFADSLSMNFPSWRLLIHFSRKDYPSKRRLLEGYHRCLEFCGMFGLAQEQLLSGVRAVMPIAAVAGILMGDYRNRAEVATGQYNADIEAKIEHIKRSCNK